MQDIKTFEQDNKDPTNLNEFLNNRTSCTNKRDPRETNWHRISRKELRDQFPKNITIVNPLLDELMGEECNQPLRKQVDRFSDLDITSTYDE